MMAKAVGRSLGDFRTFFHGERLFPAEEGLLRACAEGHFFHPGPRTPRPTGRKYENFISAAFLRFLLLGGDENAAIHEQGVQVQGAWIEGTLDLEGAILPNDIALNNCWIEGDIKLIAARTRRIDLDGSRISNFVGDGVEIHGDLFLRNGFLAERGVQLTGAAITGDLDCNGGSFKKDEKAALRFNRANIDGNVFLNNKFAAEGEVCLVGAKIAGDMDCRGGTFNNPTNAVAQHAHALNFDRADIGAVVFIGEGFSATGVVRLHDAKIRGYLDCRGGNFVGAPLKELIEQQHPDTAKIALSMNRARVVDRFFIRDLSTISGNISLAHAHVGALHDDTLRPDAYKKEEGWQDSYFYLDGFTYDRLHTGATVSWTDRLHWLEAQPPKLLSKNSFRPQPWNQIIKVLREMGNVEQARKLAIAKEDHIRKIGKCKWYVLPFHFIYGKLAGYGHRPSWLVMWMVGTWFVCGLLYYLAAHEALFGPSDPSVFHELNLAHCRPDAPVISTTGKRKVGNWWWCPELPREYTSFSPFLYSLDLILPVVNLGQAQNWRPITRSADPDNRTRSQPISFLLDLRDVVFLNLPLPIWTDWGRANPWSRHDAWGYAVRLLTWLENLFGWAASLLMVATLSDLIKKDES